MLNKQFKIQEYAAQLSETIDRLPTELRLHVNGTEPYLAARENSWELVKNIFAEDSDGRNNFGPFGLLDSPFYKMGNIDSRHLFGFDELVIFSFYWVNRKRYSKVADLGANIGLHSFVLNRCGYEVRCYEPDPELYLVLGQNLERNGLSRRNAYNVAVSKSDGTEKFIKVMDNRTGSHIAGSKPNPYGPLEEIEVETIAFAPVLEWADLLKIDVEGHEAEIITSVPANAWADTDAFVEVGSGEENAGAIFNHFKNSCINLFSQNTHWKKVESLDGMPKSHQEGTLFISSLPKMPWPKS